MNLYTNHHGVELDFEVSIHEERDTTIWQAVVLPTRTTILFVETYNEPSERHLIEKILDAYAAEVAAEHGRIIREELDHGNYY